MTRRLVPIPIEEMTDAELEAEACCQAEAGDEVHAGELRLYRAIRATAREMGLPLMTVLHAYRSVERRVRGDA